jgi:NAD(P)-dependent dehydrogenase (short-subunit alcohol dehydrogenase family)
MPRFLVTGASSGIGAATAALLRDEGDEVVELDVRPRTGGIACDLGDPDDVRRAARSIDGEFDGIAQVAGVPGTLAPERVLAINFLGPRLLAELLLPKLRRGGSIVFVSSLASLRCTWSDAELDALAAEAGWAAANAHLAARETDGSQAYDLSKRLLVFALPGFVRDASGLGVRVNLVSPGPVETPILDDFRTTMGHDRIAAAAGLAGRHGRPDEIAAAIAFLLRPAASWINGADLVVDGGLSALRQSAARELASREAASR